MKNSTKIKFAIALILWVIGSVLVYKKGSANSPIIITGVMLVIGFVSQISKKVSKE
jgi:hypothetical protein